MFLCAISHQFNEVPLCLAVVMLLSSLGRNISMPIPIHGSTVEPL